MRIAAVAALLTFLAACDADRPRPTPLGPLAEPRLTVQVDSPLTGSTVIAGRTVRVVVLARDLNRDYLAGIGFVARRGQGPEKVDSVVRMLDPFRSVRRDTYTFTVPAHYPRTTMIEVIGLAFGPQGQTRTSVAKSLTVMQCRPDIPACQFPAANGTEGALR